MLIIKLYYDKMEINTVLLRGVNKEYDKKLIFQTANKSDVNYTVDENVVTATGEPKNLYIFLRMLQSLFNMYIS